MSDNRRFARGELPSADPSDLEGISYVANIGVGGAFIKTNQIREVGSSFGITIKLPLRHTPPIKANCTVRWINEFEEDSPWKIGMGVEFKDISSKSRGLIQRYVQKISRKKTKRKTQRNTVKAPVDYKYQDQWITGQTGNLSRGGVYIKTDSPPPTQAILRLKIHLPHREEPIYVRGKVKWSNQEIPDQMGEVLPQGMGVEFFSLKKEDKLEIARYVKENHS